MDIYRGFSQQTPLVSASDQTKNQTHQYKIKYSDTNENKIFNKFRYFHLALWLMSKCSK